MEEKNVDRLPVISTTQSISQINTTIDFHVLLYREKKTWSRLLTSEQQVVDKVITELLEKDLAAYNIGKSEVSRGDITSFVAPMLAGRKILGGQTEQGELQHTLKIREDDLTFRLGREISETMCFGGFRALYELTPQWTEAITDYWQEEAQKALAISDFQEREESVARLNQLWAHAKGQISEGEKEPPDQETQRKAQQIIFNYLPKRAAQKRREGYKLPPSLREFTGQPIPETDYTRFLVRRSAFELMKWQPLVAKEKNVEHPIEFFDWENKFGDQKIEDFRAKLQRFIEEAIDNIPSPKKTKQTLTQHREGKCIYNDHVAKGMSQLGLKVRLVSSRDTGRLPTGSFSNEVIHEHDIPVVNIPDTNKVAVVDISAAQFSPINPDLKDQEAVVILVNDDEESIKSTCQALFGGGKWSLEEWVPLNAVR